MRPPPLAIDYVIAGVGSFYGGVHHACVVARPAYGPVPSVAVVDAEQVVAAATLGHVAVVGVASGVEVVMTALGDHPVAHPVAYPLEEHLVGPGGHAGGGALALDHSPDRLGQGRAASSHHQRHEHRRRHGYHHRYLLGAHLFLLPFSGEGDSFGARAPLSVLPTRAHII